MRSIAAMLAAAAVALVATDAGAAGLTLIDIPARGDMPALTGGVWYPCAAAPAEIGFGPLSVTAVRDCPVTGSGHPLVVMSHGVGGWFGGHHDTAEALADAGFIVAAINHPLDSGQSKIRRPGDIVAMIERPQDIRRLVDHMLTDWPESGRIDPERIGAFGFSRGGYTVLAAIGGTPDFRMVLSNCPTYPGNRWCEQIRDGSALAEPPARDARIKAAVIADPALGFTFTPAGLADVAVPVQLWASEHGGDGVLPRDAAAVDRGLPTKPDYRVVPGSGHFAFLAPCGTALAKAVADFGEPEVCADADGFDRVAFHRQFNAAVLAFFDRRLLRTKTP
ncbi:alpha/beta hydrolase family protein [Inquilinus sp. NPDC058860]|uniref:alpha/beta hydrolase family protein n=1 Tax=Inquilinus sp. NPDC058860 TaxID=3346652 RepID=UPI003685BD2A